MDYRLVHFQQVFFKKVKEIVFLNHFLDLLIFNKFSMVYFQ